jgi:hypothetical protein
MLFRGILTFKGYLGMDLLLASILLAEINFKKADAPEEIMLEKTILLGDIIPVIALFAAMCFGSFLLATWRLKKETAY